MTFGCAVDSYTSTDAFKLADEWCRRMQWYYDQCCECDEEDYVYPQDVLDGYVETTEFFEWAASLPPNGNARARVTVLRALRPSVHPQTHGEQVSRKRLRKSEP